MIETGGVLKAFCSYSPKTGLLVPVIRTTCPEKLAMLADSTGRWSYKHVRKYISGA